MTADTRQKLQDELMFVRGAVERLDRRQYASVALSVLWATIIGGGFTLIDFDPTNAQWFWMTVPIVGFSLSFWIGSRAGWQVGVSRRDGWKHGLHWGSLLVLCGAVVSIAVAHQFEGRAVGQLFTLLVGAVYFLGGVHLDRRFVLPGISLVVGSAALDYLQPYPWTIVGLVTASALVASALWMKGKDEKQAEAS